MTGLQLGLTFRGGGGAVFFLLQPEPQEAPKRRRARRASPTIMADRTTPPAPPPRHPEPRAAVRGGRRRRVAESQLAFGFHGTEPATGLTVADASVREPAPVPETLDLRGEIRPPWLDAPLANIDEEDAQPEDVELEEAELAKDEKDRTLRARATKRDIGPRLFDEELEGCKALLQHIIRRAAFDWVLYRDATRPAQRDLANEAYEWLFVEGPGHPRWDERKAEGRHLTSFLAICDELELVPERVRAHVRRLTRAKVMGIGRPAEYR